MIVIGVDVGGTSIKGAAIRDNGEILDRFQYDMNRDASPEDTFGHLAGIINSFMIEHHYNEEISGVGLGIPGLIDKEKGTVASSPNMPKWLNFNIVKFLEERINLPIRIVNDASAAALGEARFGSGKNYKYLVMITLGTGVGGGIVYNKHLIDGMESTGAQLGHQIIEMDGRPCGCGRRGCLEMYASATALGNDTKIAMENNKDTILPEVVKEVGKLNARAAFIAARRGDRVGQELVDNYVKYLGEGLLNICNTLRPEIIVLSGGVANEGEYLISRLDKYLAKYDYGMINAPKVIIKQAILGYDAGKIGAACLFFE